MTEETLSALLDGECSPAELDALLEAMDRDPRLKDRYSRLCLARDTRQGARYRRADIQFADRVVAALDREPGPRVVTFRPRRTLPLRFWRPLAGLAAAAAIGAVAVLAVRPSADPAPLTVAQPTGGAAPLNVVQPVQDQRWNQLEADYAKQLNQYLLTYNHSRARQGMGSTLGYARYTAYTAEPVPAADQRR
jgi:negative regulator of sigma E activity